MFLRGTKNASFPEEERITAKTLQHEWRRINELKETLQNRFRREYLGQLVEHSKSSASPVVEVGDIVLVGADNKKRHTWPMARVVELFPGADNVIRTAKVKTKFGCLIRPLQRLYPLEISKSNSKPTGIQVHIENGPEPNTENEAEESNKVDTQNNEERITRSGRKTRKPIRYGWNE